MRPSFRLWEKGEKLRSPFGRAPPDWLPSRQPPPSPWNSASSCKSVQTFNETEYTGIHIFGWNQNQITYVHPRREESKFVYQHRGGRYVILTFCGCDRVEKLIILQLETFDISNVICWRSHCTELWKCFSYCGLKGNSGAIGISTTLPHHHFATLPDFQIAKLPAVF